MSSRRHRPPPNPEHALIDAHMLATGRPTSRNRKRLHAARIAAAERVDLNLKLAA
ncbi:MAG: hypothetical protein ACREQ5_05825 [Candidatus Dormibacteria bacterium]